MNKGKIIVLEGLDGCGKSTQLNILFNSLQSAGKTRLISFPNYESSTGRVVSDYLQGAIPCEGSAGAYAASGFYASKLRHRLEKRLRKRLCYRIRTLYDI